MEASDTYTASIVSEQQFGSCVDKLTSPIFSFVSCLCG